jgi:thymidylate synthase
MSANESWISLLNNLLNAPVCQPRGMLIKELLAHTSTIPMEYPIVTIHKRDIGFRFMPAEAYWMITGDNRVETIEDYSPTIKEFSDDGLRFSGAYGPRIIDQLKYVCDMLLEDNDTRQSVMTIWRSNPRPSKDIPCTMAIQWTIRDGIIHCHDYMRSSDAWLGWPYDVFNFTMLTGYIMLVLKKRGLYNLSLGNLYLTAGSQHLYEKNWIPASDLSICKKHNKWEYEPFNPYSFNSPNQLLEQLHGLAHGRLSECPNEFMTEVFANED